MKTWNITKYIVLLYCFTAIMLCSTVYGLGTDRVPLVPGYRYAVSDDSLIIYDDDVRNFSVALVTLDDLNVRHLTNSGILEFVVLAKKKSDCGYLDIAPNASPLLVRGGNNAIKYHFIGEASDNIDDYAQIRIWQHYIVWPIWDELPMEIDVVHIATDLKYYPKTKVWVLTIESFDNLGINIKTFEKVVNIQSYIGPSPVSPCAVYLEFRGIRI